MTLVWKANTPIYWPSQSAGFLAYAEGDIVPDANVALYGYATAGVVTQVDVSTTVPGSGGAAHVTVDQLTAGLASLPLNVMSYGAIGDGVNNDTSAVQAAVTAAAGGVVLFPAGKTFKVSGVTLPDADLTILAHGATIQTTTAGTYAFTSTYRRRTAIYGGKFTGLGSGFHHNIAPTGNDYQDIRIVGASFVLPVAEYGVNLAGSRSSSLTDCYFETCIGIRLDQAVDTQVINCHFKACAKGIWGGTTGTTHPSYDTGLQMQGVTMLSCTVGLYLRGWDWVTITDSNVDYNDTSVELHNVYSAVLSGSYFGNHQFGAGPSVNPPISIDTDATIIGGGNSRLIRIENCQIAERTTSAALYSQSIALKIKDVDSVRVSGCQILAWQQYGIKFEGTVIYANVTENDIYGNASGTLPASIYGLGSGEESWAIQRNRLGSPIRNVATAYAVRDNFPPATPNASAAAGAGTSPPTPTMDSGSTDHAGVVRFGSGTSPIAGNYVTVFFGTAYARVPKVTITPMTSALALKTPYLGSVTVNSFSITFPVAGAASQASTVWAASYVVEN